MHHFMLQKRIILDNYINHCGANRTVAENLNTWYRHKIHSKYLHLLIGGLQKSQENCLYKERKITKRDSFSYFVLNPAYISIFTLNKLRGQASPGPFDINSVCNIQLKQKLFPLLSIDILCKWNHLKALVSKSVIDVYLNSTTN